MTLDCPRCFVPLAELAASGLQRAECQACETPFELKTGLVHGIARATIEWLLVVLDTSVIVAAWKSRRGASFALLERLDDDDFTIALSVPLVIEYEAVLLRHLTHGRNKSDVTDLVDYLCSVAHLQTIFYLWRPLLRDAKDDLVAELAVAAQARAVVTHDIRDFSGVDRFGVEVLTPGAFLQSL